MQSPYSINYGYSPLDAVFKWKSKTSHEIDFVAAVDRIAGQKNLLPLEVKYQNCISEWDWKLLEKSFGRGTLVTKDKVEIEAGKEILVVALEKFLMGV